MSDLVPELARGYAEFSEDGKYRWLLGRFLGAGPADDNGAVLLWIMLNPSTADAHADDPTIRKCAYFAQQNNYRRFEVVNLYAYRTPRPDALYDARSKGVDIVGDMNALVITQAMRRATAVVVAWGDSVMEQHTPNLVIQAISKPLCLGWTKRGNPRHPLWASRSSTLQSFPKDWRQRT